MSCLFDEDEADLVPEDLLWARKLIVGAPPANPEDLATLEGRYRRMGCPPVLFIDDDGLWNVGTFAAAMGVAASGLTLEMAERWLAKQPWPSWEI